MKALFNFILATLFILFCFGCSDSIDHQLDEAENLIPVDTVRSLQLLNDIDISKISDKQRNRLILYRSFYNVIYNKADTLSDKEIKEGNKKFSGKLNSDGIKWLIIKSHDANLKSDPVGRLENLKDAEFLANQLGRKEELAFTYLYLADLYNELFNASASGYYAEKSRKLFSELNYPIHLRSARMFSVGSLVNLKDFKSALDTLEAMRPEVMANANENYKAYFMEQVARLYIANGRARESVIIWRELYDGKEIPSQTLINWAYAYLVLNELDSAQMFIKKAQEIVHNPIDRHVGLNIEYRIYEKLGQLEKLASIDSLRFAISDSINAQRKLDETGLSLDIKYNNDTQEAWAEANKANIHTLISIFVSIIFILVLLIVWLLLNKRNRMLRLEHENDMLKIQTLQNNLFESDNRNKELNSRISELFQSRFKLMDSLASTYFECKDTNQEQKRLYYDVKCVLNNFRSEETLMELTDIVNAYTDNLMAKFKSEFPSLSASQYRLALYLFCGFSLPSISFFTGSNLNNLYVYKSRLKSIISKSTSSLKEEFLSNLS